MRKAITKRAVDGLECGQIIADDEVRVSWSAPAERHQDLRPPVPRQNHRQRRWDALGLHGSITPDQARTLARKRAGEVADNRDPLAERRAQRLAAKRADGLAFRAIAERFIERHAKKENRRWAETDRILRRDACRLGATVRSRRSTART